jgi:predicted DNA-binding transcriptional regulator YafY
VSLALRLANAQRRPVTWDQIRDEVAGYPDDQDYDAFIRMFERDKDALKRMGFAIEVTDDSAYRLEPSETYASAVELSAREAAAVSVAATALLADESFPHAAALRLALAKISAELRTAPIPAAAHLADEDPGRQGASAAALWAAMDARKTVTFGYTNSRGESAPHAVEPWGIFLHDGRWYAVGRDTSKGEVRTYAVARMKDVSVNDARPKHPDFVRPDDFDIQSFIRLPFQYGPAADEFEAEILFDASSAWRAVAVTAGSGVLSSQPDGSATWRVVARSRERLLRFAIENGPGLSVVSPQGLLGEMRAGLERVAADHG